MTSRKSPERTTVETSAAAAAVEDAPAPAIAAKKTAARRTKIEATAGMPGLIGQAPVKKRAPRKAAGAKTAKAKTTKSAPRGRRASVIDAGALISAEKNGAAQERLAESAEVLEGAREFEEAFPLILDMPFEDPDAPRTGPAKLPDLRLIEELEAQAREEKRWRRIAMKPKKKPAATGSAAVRAKLADLLRSSLEEAADHLLGRSSPEFALVPLNPVRVIVAVSGGRDSMALLDVATRLFKEKRQALIAELEAVYVHHGYEPGADVWEEHCRSECAKRGIPFRTVRVRVALKGEGVEAAAREARYRALAHFALKEGFDIVMTAHHEDDRIETFLLQWMRGAGLEGLAAFPEARELASPSVEDAPAVQAGRQAFLLRPWTGVPRCDIERYVKSRKLAYVDDPDNENPQFSRSRVRREVIPLLEKIRPGFRSAAARSVSLVAEALDVLKSVARSDLERCRSEERPRGLSIFRLLELIPARQAWCLRAWLSEEGLRPISKARLEDMLRQVRETHSDATFAIRFQGRELRRWGADLVIRDAVVSRSGAERSAVVQTSQGAIALPDWGGEIEVIPCRGDEPGIARSRLTAKGAQLETRSTNGAAKLRLWALRPAKALKDLYAQAGIPAYARADLPRLWLNGELLFAAGLGMDVRFFDDPEKFPDRVRLRWRPEHSLWDDRAVPNYAELPDAERRAREERVRETILRLAEKRAAAAKAAKPTGGVKKR